MFGEWIIKIVGLGALGVLLDVILPEGETNKYIKGIFGIVTVFVLFSPLPDLLKIKVDIDDIFLKSSETIEIDDSYTYYVYEKKWEQTERTLSAYFTEKYSTECAVDIKFVESCPEKIDVVYFYFKNLVIEGSETNKYRVEVVKEVGEWLNVNDGQVVVRYG